MNHFTGCVSAFICRPCGARRARTCCNLHARCLPRARPVPLLPCLHFSRHYLYRNFAVSVFLATTTRRRAGRPFVRCSRSRFLRDGTRFALRQMNITLHELTLRNLNIICASDNSEAIMQKAAKRIAPLSFSPALPFPPPSRSARLSPKGNFRVKFG